MLDNVVHHHTPEGTILTLVPAGVVVRLQAWLVDMLIRFVILAIFAFVLSLFEQGGVGLLLIVYFLVDWFYAVLFEVYKEGQTIGKKLMKIKVCQDNGTALTWQASMIRNLLRVADFLPMMFVAGALSMLFNTQSKRLGDMVAGTLVVYVPQLHQQFAVVNKPAVSPKIPLYFDEQQAILAFVERQDELPLPRQMALANILTPLTYEQNPQLVSDELIGIANGILGNAGKTA